MAENAAALYEGDPKDLHPDAVKLDQWGNPRDSRGKLLPGGPGLPNSGPKSGSSRKQLTAAFLRDLNAAWEEHGLDATLKVAREEPKEFLRIVAHLMPREAKLDVSGQSRVIIDFTGCFEPKDLPPGAKSIDGAWYSADGDLLYDEGELPEIVDDQVALQYEDKAKTEASLNVERLEPAGCDGPIHFNLGDDDDLDPLATRI